MFSPINNNKKNTKNKHMRHKYDKFLHEKLESKFNDLETLKKEVSTEDLLRMHTQLHEQRASKRELDEHKKSDFTNNVDDIELAMRGYEHKKRVEESSKKEAPTAEVSDVEDDTFRTKLMTSIAGVAKDLGYSHCAEAAMNAITDKSAVVSSKTDRAGVGIAPPKPAGVLADINAFADKEKDVARVRSKFSL